MRSCAERLQSPPVLWSGPPAGSDPLAEVNGSTAVDGAGQLPLVRDVPRGEDANGDSWAGITRLPVPPPEPVGDLAWGGTDAAMRSARVDPYAGNGSLDDDVVW